MEYGWTVDDEFFVETGDGTWRIDAATGPQSAVTPACLLPKTTSSAVSADGLYIQPTTDPASPINTYPSSDLPPFGDC